MNNNLLLLLYFLLFYSAYCGGGPTNHHKAITKYLQYNGFKKLYNGFLNSLSNTVTLLF